MKISKNILIALFVVLFASFFSYPFVLQSAPNLLYIRDKLEKSDVILVLAGDSNGERVSQAVELYKEGWAPKILMSGGPAVWHLTYAKNMRAQATSLGVPEKDVILQDMSKSTLEDIKFSYVVLKRLGSKKVILVTSPYHIKRSSLVANKYFKQSGIKVIAYPAQKSVFMPKKWWTRHEDTQFVVWEIIAMLEYLLKGELF